MLEECILSISFLFLQIVFDARSNIFSNRKAPNESEFSFQHINQTRSAQVYYIRLIFPFISSLLIFEELKQLPLYNTFPLHHRRHPTIMIS
jgi:hypothetical protein